MKKPFLTSILDAIAVPAWWATRQLVALLDDIARINPHSMAAGFSEELDAARLKAIRAVLERGQKFLPAPTCKFLLAQLDRANDDRRGIEASTLRDAANDVEWCMAAVIDGERKFSRTDLASSLRARAYRVEQGIPHPAPTEPPRVVGDDE